MWRAIFIKKNSFATSFSDNSRVPWDALRFVRQSSKFVTLPNPLSHFVPTDKKYVKPGDVLWSPASNNLFTFLPLDDVVMGGASRSSFYENTDL